VPNVKFQTGDKSGAKKEASGIYNGDTPPRGLYKVLARRLGMKINRNGDPMLNCLVEIQEPGSSSKAKYNGYGFWWNGNVTDEGAGYINQFLDAISGEDVRVRKAFWNGKCRTSEMPKKGKTVAVTAIGPLKIKQEGMPAVVSAFKGKPFKGEINLRVGDWLLPAAATEMTDDDVDTPDDEDVDAEYAEVVEDAEVIEDDDDDDSEAAIEVDDDDDDDGDDDGDDDDAVDVSDDDGDGDDDDDEPPF
jgi:hypothetical protein